MMRDHPRPIAVCRAESVLKKFDFNCSCLAPAGTYCHRLLCLSHQLMTRWHRFALEPIGASGGLHGAMELAGSHGLGYLQEAARGLKRG